jgi:ribonucleotide monophosphatase NagD (HAD superfamily)
MFTGGGALLIDLDGVLYVEEDSIPGAVEAVERFAAADSRCAS